MPASAEVVEVVLGVVLVVLLVLLGLLVLLVFDPVPLAAGVGVELGELAFELPVEPVELLFEPVDGELEDGLAGWPEGLVQVASGSTYCWLPADGEHPLCASAAELMVSPSASDTRMPRTIWNKRLTPRIQAMLENKRVVTACDPSNVAALQ